MTTRPVAVRVSQATRLNGSSVRQASRTASEIWSAILSGWPSVTDSEVKRYRFRGDNSVSPSRGPPPGLRGRFQIIVLRNGHRMSVLRSLRSYQRTPAGATNFTRNGRWTSGTGVMQVRWRRGQVEWLQRGSE